VHAHQATISATVMDSGGKLVMESILETKTATVPQFIHTARKWPFAEADGAFPGLAQVV